MKTYIKIKSYQVINAGYKHYQATKNLKNKDKAKIDSDYYAKYGFKPRISRA